MTHGGANGGRFLRATEIEAASPPIAATPFRALQDTVEDDHNHEENGNEVHNGVETEGDGIHLDEHEDEDHHDETVATSSPLEGTCVTLLSSTYSDCIQLYSNPIISHSFLI